MDARKENPFTYIVYVAISIYRLNMAAGIREISTLTLGVLLTTVFPLMALTCRTNILLVFLRCLWSWIFGQKIIVRNVDHCYVAGAKHDLDKLAISIIIIHILMGEYILLFIDGSYKGRLLHYYHSGESHICLSVWITPINIILRYVKVVNIVIGLNNFPDVVQTDMEFEAGNWSLLTVICDMVVLVKHGQV